MDNKKLEIDGSQLKMYTGDKLNAWLYNLMDGYPLFVLSKTTGSSAIRGQYSATSIRLGYNDSIPNGGVELSGDGVASLRINDESSPKSLSWKDNGDGTYTLIGR